MNEISVNSNIETPMKHVGVKALTEQFFPRARSRSGAHRMGPTLFMVDLQSPITKSSFFRSVPGKLESRGDLRCCSLSSVSYIKDPYHTSERKAALTCKAKLYMHESQTWRSTVEACGPSI